MIHADQLSKEFGRFQAVKNASFQIEKGEIVGFLGPNGAGKTTTLRMLTGYLPPTSGTATIAGFDIVKNPLEARKHLGYLPEHVPLYDDQRVTEYLKFRARLKGISSKQIWPAVSKVVEQCGLDPVRRKMIRTLSKGYRQRVGLADALLGAAGLGDIGRHFPDTDPAYAGADSLKLLDYVVELLEAQGWKVGNVDATILAQRPKLAPHLEQMRENLAARMKVEPEQVNVKATTEEGLGFTGDGSGMAAHAVALLEIIK